MDIIQEVKENLRPDEIELVNEILGSDQKCLCRAIAQVAIDRSTFLGNHFPTPDNNLTSENNSMRHDKNNNVFDWYVVLNVGVIAFTQDIPEECHYIKLIDMEKGKVVLSHKLARNTIFQRRRRFITTFETEFGTLCLNFVDDDEADVFMRELNKFSSYHECNSWPSNNVKCLSLDDSKRTNLRVKHERKSKTTTSSKDMDGDINKKNNKKQSLAGKFKQLFSIRGSIDNLSKKKVSKEYFKNKLIAFVTLWVAVNNKIQT